MTTHLGDMLNTIRQEIVTIKKTVAAAGMVLDGVIILEAIPLQ